MSKPVRHHVWANSVPLLQDDEHSKWVVDRRVRLVLETRLACKGRRDEDTNAQCSLEETSQQLGKRSKQNEKQLEPYWKGMQEQKFSLLGERRSFAAKWRSKR